MVVSNQIQFADPCTFKARVLNMTVSYEAMIVAGMFGGTKLFSNKMGLNSATRDLSGNTGGVPIISSSRKVECLCW